MLCVNKQREPVWWGLNAHDVTCVQCANVLWRTTLGAWLVSCFADGSVFVTMSPRRAA